MIEKLNKENLTPISGGGSYCVFPDGKVLVCNSWHPGEPDHPFWVLYDDAEAAIKDKQSYLNFGDLTPIYYKYGNFIAARRVMEEKNVTTLGINDI